MANGLTLTELQWLPANVDRVRALTTEPRACVSPTASPAIAEQVRLGEMAFNSPALLGGQAEKKGLSCGSCHRNGRGNADFQFEAISGAPGTADVTSGLFSTARADNKFNPVPIPDLAMPAGRDQVDRTDRTALGAFVRGQIEEEFSGDRTPDEVFEPLLTYLQHIDGQASDCQTAPQVRTSWTGDWADAELAGQRARVAQSDTAQAFYMRTSRLALGRLHARYAGADQADIRAQLVMLSRQIESGAAWPDDMAVLEARLETAAPSSLYNAEALSAALELSGR